MNWTKVRIALEEQANAMLKEIGEDKLPYEMAGRNYVIAEVCNCLAVALKFGEKE